MVRILKYCLSVIVFVSLISFLYLQYNSFQKMKVFSNYKSSNYQIGNNKYLIYIATTPKEQELGLSIASVLPKNQGMIFEFPDYGFHSFWMKDMKIGLDMLFINDTKIVDILENITPQTYPQTFTSKTPANKVIEIPLGEAKMNKISIGDTVKKLD